MSVTLTSQLKALHENNIHRYAVLWRLERADGTILRFTDHNTDITFKGNTYLAAVGFQVSATQRSSGLSESNKEGNGIIVPVSATGIKEEDLRGGRYRNAKVTEYLIDWQYPWAGEYYKTKYTLADITYTDGFWKTNMVSESRFLRLPVGKVFSRNCRHRLGEANHYLSDSGLSMFESRCGFVLTGTVPGVSGTITAKTNTTVSVVTNARKKFSVAIANITTNYPANVFRFGVAKFTSGKNSGLSFEISANTLASGVTASVITLFIDAPYDIAVSDAVTLTVGCDKTLATCNTKFANKLNFGGFPDIPGMDRAIFIPDRV
jgi:uncharacterized phage protein (TIGR02218 family)